MFLPGTSVSLPFPAFRGHLGSVAHGPFLILKAKHSASLSFSDFDSLHSHKDPCDYEGSPR